MKPPPEPPRDPVAWLPPGSSVIARVDLAAWRQTSLAEYVGRFEQVGSGWIEFDRVQALHIGLEPQGQDQFSAVGVLTGPFGADYLAQRAQAEGKLAELHGETPVYPYEDTRWVQVRDDMLVGATQDRVDWMLARLAGVPAASLRTTPLFEAIAPAVEFDTAHVTMLLEDADGSAKQALNDAEGIETSRITHALTDVVRGGIRVRFDTGLSVTALGDADSEPHAQQLEGLLRGYLERWRGSPMLMLFGLRDVVAGLTVQREGSRVTVSAQISQAQLDALMDRLGPMLENLFDVGVRPEMDAASPEADPAPQPVVPPIQTVP